MCDQACWLKRMTLLVLLTIGVSAGLIAAGATNPTPKGDEIWREGRSLRTLPAKSRRLVWLEALTPAEAFSLRLGASLHEGDSDVGYGVVIGDELRYLAVMVSPLGYVAVCYGAESVSPTLPESVECPLPWQTWPHVSASGGRNEIQLDVEDRRVIARINREEVWRGAARDLGDQMGWIAESFAGPAVLDIENIQLYAILEDSQ